MSALKTYDFIQSFVRKKLDLQEEGFITTAEMLEYCEEALKECEAEVHKLMIHDMYFVTQAPIAFQSGQADYDLPDNIYANKILRFVFNSGAKVYNMPVIRLESRYEMSALMDRYQPADDYGYMVLNHDPRAATKIRLFPPSRDQVTPVVITGDLTLGSKSVTSASSIVGIKIGDFVTGSSVPNGTRVQAVSGTTVTLSQAAIATAVTETVTTTEPVALLWYIRAVRIPTATTDVIDFPEFWNFIAQHMVVNCLAKELGNPRYPIEKEQLEFLRQQMHDTLSNMVPDQDDGVEKDIGNYMDATGGFIGGDY